MTDWPLDWRDLVDEAGGGARPKGCFTRRISFGRSMATPQRRSGTARYTGLEGRELIPWAAPRLRHSLCERYHPRSAKVDLALETSPRALIQILEQWCVSASRRCTSASSDLKRLQTLLLPL